MRLIALGFALSLSLALFAQDTSADPGSAVGPSTPAIRLGDIPVGSPRMQRRLFRSAMPLQHALRVVPAPAPTSLKTGTNRMSSVAKLGAVEGVSLPALTRISEGALLQASNVRRTVAGPRKPWNVTIGLYAWAPAVSGTTYADGQETDIDAPFSEFADNLDHSFMGYIELRYKKWTLALDSTVVKLKTTSSGVVPGVTQTAELDQSILDLRLGYNVLCRKVGSDSWGRCCFPRFLKLDVLLGARYWNFEQRLQVGAAAGGGTVARSKDLGWVDPYVGLRFRWQFAKRWGLSVYGDMGGFKIGNSLGDEAAGLTWQLQAHVRYRITRGLFLSLGYRTLNVDTVKDVTGTVSGVELTYSGPIIGIGYEF